MLVILDLNDWLPQIATLFITGTITGITTYFFTLRKARIDLQNSIQKERTSRKDELYFIQRYEYFLRFKWFTDEFRRRIDHILRRLSAEGKESNPEKYNNMVIRLNQDIESQNANKLEWYFNDSVGKEGGYFFISTIYMNCLFLYWLKKIQWEYPYMPLIIGKSNTVDEIATITNCNKNLFGENTNNQIKKKCDFHILSKNLKYSLSGNRSIPYGIQDSIGDFIFDHDKEKVLNYEEFCHLLQSKENRIKFMPVISFWRNLISSDNIPDQNLIRKLTQFQCLLNLIEITDILDK